MTRESLLNGCSKYSCNDVVKIEAVKIVINMIFDDFDSRTCENCKHYKEMCGYGITAPLFSPINTREFGCNKFERKQ